MSMSSRVGSLVAISALATLAACSPDQPGQIVGPRTSVNSAANSGQPFQHERVCQAATAGSFRCHSLWRVNEAGEPLATTVPNGFGPTDLREAYGLGSASGGVGQTIAIVDAFDDAHAESDLAVYRAQFGMAPCTTANGCFRKVDQRGGTDYPVGDKGWAAEISLDLDMASAICPNCKLILVEANTNSNSNLYAAVDEAVSLGANVISNSYGGREYPREIVDESHYNHPGHVITVSSGDEGYVTEFPASSQYVTAVGGTSLIRDGSARGFSERAWRGAGSGCSAFVVKPAWQSDPECPNRTVSDVSAVADPATGVAVYDTDLLAPSNRGWLVFGGTSVSAPIIAGVYALAGNASSVNYGSFSYSHLESLFDVLSGKNGSCNGSYLCTALPGYDGPTGNGTPNGTGAF